MLPHLLSGIRLLGSVVAVAGLAIATPASGIQEPPPDSLEVHGQARTAQRDFEVAHRRLLPRGVDQRGNRCDEYLGRLCLSEGEPGWAPLEEDSLIVQARSRLLDLLEEAGNELPQDRWILGQRVRYLGDIGRWEEARELARQCQGGPEWWCPGLLGFVLHRSGKTVESLEAFSKSLAAMDWDRALEWEDPYPLLEYPASRWIRNPSGLSPREAITRFWTLSDPLFLTPGNERLSEHYARRFAPAIYSDAELTLDMPWGQAFEQLFLRYGFPAGWDQVPTRMNEVGIRDVVVHHHPESRGLLPPYEALEDPNGLPEGVWVPHDERPRTATAPVLAPLIAQGQAQIAVLRRDGNLLILAAYGMPVDTVFQRLRPQEGAPAQAESGREGGPVDDGTEAGERRGRPLWEPGVEGYPPGIQTGLYLLADTDEWAPYAALGVGGEGLLQLTAPPGAYLLSLEQWNPTERWGARIRNGIGGEEIPAGVPHLSDLLLLDPEDALPGSLAEAAPRLRTSLEAPSASQVTVGWEVYGLSRQREILTFRLSLVEEGESLVRRALKRIGLFRKDPALTLTWSETGPGELGPFFRAIDVDLPALDPGRYVLRLEMDIPYRSRVVSNRRISVF